MVRVLHSYTDKLNSFNVNDLDTKQGAENGDWFHTLESKKLCLILIKVYLFCIQSVY